MTAALLDTHVWVWLYSGERPVPERTRSFMETADEMIVSAISVYEIARKTVLGKWPGMTATLLERLVAESAQAGLSIKKPETSTMLRAGFLDWDHRDPWDRLIAATALQSDAMLISADPAFDRIPGLERLWQ